MKKKTNNKHSFNEVARNISYASLTVLFSTAALAGVGSISTGRITKANIAFGLITSVSLITLSGLSSIKMSNIDKAYRKERLDFLKSCKKSGVDYNKISKNSNELVRKETREEVRAKRLKHLMKCREQGLSYNRAIISAPRRTA